MCMGGLSEGLTPSPHHKGNIMFTSNRIHHDSALYHEHIFFNDTLVAQVMSEENGTYWFVLTRNNSLSRGYKTVADAKKLLFMSLDCIYA